MLDYFSFLRRSTLNQSNLANEKPTISVGRYRLNTMNFITHSLDYKSYRILGICDTDFIKYYFVYKYYM